jgi:sialic acid synthase SpsE
VTTTTEVRLGERIIGAGAPAFVLAEIASAHQGSADEAIALARFASDAGADGVKFQLFRAGELIAPNDTRRETFDQIELSVEEWDRVLGESSELGVPLLAEVFDRESLSIAERSSVVAYKVHTTDMENPEFVRDVAATGKPLLLATGGYGIDAVAETLELARSAGNEQVVLLHGVQNFPTNVADSHLRYIECLKERFGLPVGFLDHVDGGSEMALLLPALAVAFGADLIEKHITRDRSAEGFDYQSSLEPKSFTGMVSLLREAESSFGSSDAPSGSSASRYHSLMRRGVLSGTELATEKPLAREDVVFLRNERGLAPKDVGRILGRKPKERIAAFEPLTVDLFEAD